MPASQYTTQHSTSNSAPISTRRDFLATLAIAGSALALSPYAKAFAQAQADPTIFKWNTVAPGFHALIDLNTGGNALIVSAQSAANSSTKSTTKSSTKSSTKPQSLLIDTKFANLAGALHKDLVNLSDPEATLTLINTHHHGDHTGGNALLIPHTTNSYAHQNAIPRIINQLDRFKQAAQSGLAQSKRANSAVNSPDSLLKQAIAAADASESWTADSIAPKNPIEESTSINLGSIPLTMHHFGPGHTDNDLVVHFEDHNIIHTGDLVFAGLHPFFDPSAGVTAIGWIDSLKSILALCGPKTTIIPGHGPIGTKQLVESQLNYLEQLIEHVQADIDAGKSKQESKKQEWDFMKGLGFESIRPRAIEAVYDELAI